MTKAIVVFTILWATWGLVGPKEKQPEILKVGTDIGTMQPNCCGGSPPPDPPPPPPGSGD